MDLERFSTPDFCFRNGQLVLFVVVVVLSWNIDQTDLKLTEVHVSPPLACWD